MNKNNTTIDQIVDDTIVSNKKSSVLKDVLNYTKAFVVVNVASAVGVALAGHAMYTALRLVDQENKVDDMAQQYNTYGLLGIMTGLTSYFYQGAEYLYQYGDKGHTAVLLIPVVTNIASAIYEHIRENK